MCVGQYKQLKHISVIIIILYNYVSQCNSLDIFGKPVKDLGLNKLSLLKPINNSSLESLFQLPKNFVFAAKEVSKFTNLYLQGKSNEDIYLNGTQLIQKYGYKVEEHHVTTVDGYVLTLYRIPGKGRVVFLMHGILCSFVDWLTVGADQALPYLLAKKGYDVWMGNARGNTYSRKNKHLSPSDAAFWEFSFHEIGTKDLPAMIDYVLEKSGKKKLTYIGHSQGTTTFFVLCSTKPEYNKKIDIMIALSAVAWMKHIPNPIIKLAPNFSIAYPIVKALGLNEVAPDNDLKKVLTLTFCGNSFMASIVCQNIIFLVGGFSCSQINYKQLPVINNHAPSGCSLNQIEHYIQLIKSGCFRNFDYGLKQNLKKYGSSTPPSYPVDKISVPISIFYSLGDWLSSPVDVEHLRRKLKNVVDYYEIPLSSFNHLDYLWAKDVKKLIYDRVLTLINQHGI